jgi:hypothetical protein
VRVPYRQQVFFESDNLIERLGQQGILPSRLQSLTLIASGHSFVSNVAEVALMAEE